MHIPDTYKGIPTGTGRERTLAGNQERSDETNKFHGQEMKGYHYSTFAGIIPADSLRKEAVKEECLTFIADGLVDDDSPPEPSGAGLLPGTMRLTARCIASISAVTRSGLPPARTAIKTMVETWDDKDSIPVKMKY